MIEGASSIFVDFSGGFVSVDFCADSCGGFFWDSGALIKVFWNGKFKYKNEVGF